MKMRNLFVQQNESIHYNQDVVVFVGNTKMMPNQWNKFDIFWDLKHDISSKKDHISNPMNAWLLEKDTNVGLLEEALAHHAVKLPSKAKTYLGWVVLKEVVINGNIVSICFAV